MFLYKRQIKATKDECFRNTDASDEHITKFATRLNLQQQNLQRSGIIIDDVNKTLHYMLMMWESKMFTEPMMIGWTSRAPALRIYAHSVPLFFEAKVEALESMKPDPAGRGRTHSRRQRRQRKDKVNWRDLFMSSQ